MGEINVKRKLLFFLSGKEESSSGRKEKTLAKGGLDNKVCFGGVGVGIKKKT